MASRGINKVILVGNLGADPENRTSQTGNAITNISVATSETWKDKSTGQQQERTEWHRVVFFNRLAEIAAEYLRKGSKVYVEGSLRRTRMARIATPPRSSATKCRCWTAAVWVVTHMEAALSRHRPPSPRPSRHRAGAALIPSMTIFRSEPGPITGL